MRPLCRLLACALLLGLTACASSPSQNLRYTLPSPPMAEAVNAERPAAANRTLVLSSLELASFLDGEGIILQRDDILMHQASSHLWAEDLQRQLARGLRQRLANRLPGMRVLSSAAEVPALNLSVEVDQFQGRYDGMAIAGGRWQLRDANGKLLVLEPFSTSVPLDSDGYPALVRALGRSWDQVADSMADRIKALP